MLAALLIASYFFALGALALFGVHRLLLTVRAFARSPDPAAPPIDLDPWPEVVVQLPLYNEAFVAERLLRAAAQLKYPGSLTIQVLDDSTDETRRIVDRVAAELSGAGIGIDVLRRAVRTGFKAGALANGLERSDARLVVIFDADFVPPPDFVERAVRALLQDEGIGMVQARWGHLNRQRSWLTRAQAIYLDAHFGIEHEARQRSGHCFNFNGTAGVWRRAAIEQAGGWSHDTITEDLDLSYRAQLAGWRFVYLDALVVPAELPQTWSAFRSQQARWVRGSIETARKLAGSIRRAPDWSVRRRAEALIHVTTNFSYLLMGALAILLPITVILRERLGWQVPGGQPVLSGLDVSMLTAGTLAMLVFYLASNARTPEGTPRARLWEIVFALCLGAGMSLSNSREVLRGLRSRSSEFVRTPKAGEPAADKKPAYRAQVFGGMAALELGFASYFGATIVYAISRDLLASIPFLLLYFIGLSAVGLGSLKEAIPTKALVALERIERIAG